MKNKSILIIEDDIITAEKLHNMLVSFGYGVSLLTISEIDSRGNAGKSKPDLVLIDNHPQEVVGGVIAGELIRTQLKIPVVFLVDNSDVELLLHARISEPLIYILKPIIEDEVERIINEILCEYDSKQKQQKDPDGIGNITVKKISRYQEVLGQNEFLNNVLTSLPYPIYVVNVHDYSIVMASKEIGFNQLTKNTTCYSLIHGLENPCVGSEHPCPIQEILRTKRPVVVEHVSTNKEGKPRHLQVYGNPIFDNAGNIHQIIEYNLDISEEVLVEKKVLQAERRASTGQLLASVAHEIKNPMQSVLGCLGLAQEAVEEGQDATQYFQVARDAVGRITDIVDQMGELSRPSPGVRKQADVNKLLDEVLKLIQKQCDDNNVKVGWLVRDDIELTWMVSDQIHQVFLNLMLNALDAMLEGGQLLVSTVQTQEPAGVKISVSDTGVGITRNNLSQIFEPFFTTKEKGTGLGLSISYGLIKSHGGRLDVESTPGEGSTFIVWLPLSRRRG